MLVVYCFFWMGADLYIKVSIQVADHFLARHLVHLYDCLQVTFKP